MNADTPPSQPRLAWTVREWGRLTSLSKSYVHILIGRGEVKSRLVGKRRLILTPPEEFLRDAAE